mmetsp:Transcript_74550/g.207149  ORF Transcript_74550/g.207149 Transcript_74550/m.207149 type:complete len:260 (-) Transcript_74550:1516-2295(-)
MSCMACNISVACCWIPARVCGTSTMAAPSTFPACTLLASRAPAAAAATGVEALAFGSTAASVEASGIAAVADLPAALTAPDAALAADAAGAAAPAAAGVCAAAFAAAFLASCTTCTLLLVTTSTLLGHFCKNTSMSVSPACAKLKGTFHSALNSSSMLAIGSGPLPSFCRFVSTRTIPWISIFDRVSKSSAVRGFFASPPATDDGASAARFSADGRVPASAAFATGPNATGVVAAAAAGAAVPVALAAAAGVAAAAGFA